MVGRYRPFKDPPWRIGSPPACDSDWWFDDDDGVLKFLACGRLPQLRNEAFRLRNENESESKSKSDSESESESESDSKS